MFFYKGNIIGLLSLLVCSNAAAVKTFLPNSNIILKHGHPLLQVGGFWGTAGKTQHINIHELVGNTYTANHKTSGNALVGVGYLLEAKDFHSMHLNYGINWFYLAKTSYDGTVTQENLFTNLSYSYELTHYPLYAMLKSTVPISQLSQYGLTVDIGIGPNFMRASRYHETAINNNSIPDTPFPGETTTTFSLTAGGGIKHNNVFGAIALECGYRFFYLGQGNFGRNSNQVNTFTTGSAYANAILCSAII